MQQRSGDDSENYQAGGNITILQGLTYTEARQIALDMFEVKRRELVREAADMAQQRVEEFVTDFLNKLRERSPDAINSFRDPDMQFAFGAAEVAYARSGDKGLEELLVGLLVQRAEKQDRSLIQVVLNEAMAVLPKLLNEHLDTLSLLFIVNYTINNSILTLDILHKYLSDYFAPLLQFASRSQAGFQHLEYSACATRTAFNKSIEHDYFLGNYAALFSNGFEKDQVDKVICIEPECKELFMPCMHNNALWQFRAINKKFFLKMIDKYTEREELMTTLLELHDYTLMSKEEIRNFLEQFHPCAKDLFEYWYNTPAYLMKLTSVGIALGNARLERYVGSVADLSIWIQ